MNEGSTSPHSYPVVRATVISKSSAHICPIGRALVASTVPSSSARNADEKSLPQIAAPAPPSRNRVPTGTPLAPFRSPGQTVIRRPVEEHCGRQCSSTGSRTNRDTTAIVSGIRARIFAVRSFSNSRVMSCTRCSRHNYHGVLQVQPQGYGANGFDRPPLEPLFGDPRRAAGLPNPRLFKLCSMSVHAGSAP